MSPAVHIVSSLVGAGIVYSIFGNFICAVIFLASGVLIDLDHVFDYIREHNIRSLSVKRLLETCYEDRFEKVILIFHSYELLFILWIVITIFKLGIYWVALALGLTMHLVLDQLRNNTFVLSYFFTYRWMNNFEIKYISRKRRGKG